jgi:ribosomal protein RSM22 (predicted rRNA methylase)
MELPAPLRAAVDRALEGIPLAELQRAAGILSSRYRAELRDGRLHLDGDLAIKAYLATRLPATYAAVRTSLEAAAETLADFAPASLLDIGSGPGTALWAARDCWPSLTKARLVEASDAARKTGSALSDHLPGVTTDWVSGNAAKSLDGSLPADLVTMAYVLDELDPPTIAPLIERLWSLTQTLLVIVEPGTPAGWQRILTVRSQLIAAGAHVAAPCPHEAPCPLTQPDWCHFARRVARSRLHRLAKSGDAPFEDEKYIFIAAARQKVADRPSRVLAPPRQGKGRIELKLCQPDGAVAQAQLSKRDGDVYKVARRADWGDALEPTSDLIP